MIARIGTIAIGLGLLLTLAACGGLRTEARMNQEAGLPFNAQLSEGDDARDFTVVVAAPGATLDQFRESARFPATRHCIDVVGNSVIDWATDPATGDWTVRRTEDAEPIVAGRCARQ